MFRKTNCEIFSIFATSLLFVHPSQRILILKILSAAPIHRTICSHLCLDQAVKYGILRSRLKAVLPVSRWTSWYHTFEYWGIESWLWFCWTLHGCWRVNDSNGWAHLSRAGDDLTSDSDTDTDVGSIMLCKHFKLHRHSGPSVAIDLPISAPRDWSCLEKIQVEGYVLLPAFFPKAS